MAELASRRWRRAASALGSALAGVRFGVEKLALEIALFDIIAIDQAQGSKTGAGEKGGLDGAEGSAAYNHGGCGAEVPLAFGAERGEAGLAAESFRI